LGRELAVRPVGGALSTSARSSVMSLRFAAVRVTARGVPRPSQITWCLEPGRRRSTGEGPVFMPPLWPTHASYPPQGGTTSPVAPGLATRPVALGAGAPRPPASFQSHSRRQPVIPDPHPSLAAEEVQPVRFTDAATEIHLVCSPTHLPASYAPHTTLTPGTKNVRVQKLSTFLVPSLPDPLPGQLLPFESGQPPSFGLPWW